MATVVKINTGEIMYGTTSNNVTLLVDEILIDKNPSEPFVKGFYNFETDEFYEGATQEEIELKGRQEIPETPLWRIRAILKMIGQEENIANALSQLPEPTKTGAEYVWNYGTVIERNSQTVLFLQSVLQMTDNEVDQIFIQANNIQI